MKWLTAGSVWLVLCASAHAQSLEMKRAALSEMVGTLYTKASPNFADGKLDGCIVEYGAFIRDWTYNRGDKFVQVGGSFGLLGSGKFGAFLKVVFVDVDVKTLERRPNAPAQAAFVFGNSTNQASALGTYKSDIPGGLFVVFPPMPTLGELINQLEKGEVTLAVARERGGSAILVPIDTTVEETLPGDFQKKRSNRSFMEFLNCSREYVNNMQARAR